MGTGCLQVPPEPSKVAADIKFQIMQNEIEIEQIGKDIKKIQSELDQKGEEYKNLTSTITPGEIDSDPNIKIIKGQIDSLLLDLEAKSKKIDQLMLYNKNLKKQESDLKDGITTVKRIVNEYDANLEEYASQFNTDTMSTMEIVMTVMNDIRSNTYYGTPKEEILDYQIIN